ncbi:MAG: nuclear transport factor 2 family protein [Saprospirales bacterium]|nr:nuclear transport factor 2 family protein [Saprospirales bacterium]
MKSYSFLWIWGLLHLFPVFSHAQAAIQDSTVRAVIDQFFEGIYLGDTALIRSTLATEARLMGVSLKDQTLIDESIDKFMEAIATSQGPGFFHEKLWNYDIRVDTPIASAVTDYTFFLNGKVSHCGTNAFQLAYLQDGWKIIQIIDTRRQEGCRTEEYNLTDTLHAFLDAWHHAAAVADEDTFFGSMASEAIYLGTDAKERWNRNYMAFLGRTLFPKGFGLGIYGPRPAHLLQRCPNHRLV